MATDERNDGSTFNTGDLVFSSNGDFSYRIIQHIGEGRCCTVYSAESLRDSSTKVALKFYKRGSNYDAAYQREQYILDRFNDPKYNIVLCFGAFEFAGLRVQVLELLDTNVRQIIFRNDRQGLSPWAVRKFARDILTPLEVLHSSGFIHGDLKPANIMWSASAGVYKILDFGLTFHIDEEDIHQIQSSGYRAPESAHWNLYKEQLRQRKRREWPTSESATIFSQSIFCSSCDEEECETSFNSQTSPSLSPSKQEKPGTSADIWSFGSLLTEVITGQKLFRAADMLTTVLKPHQLLEVKIEEAEIAYSGDMKSLSFFRQIKDLIMKCLYLRPNDRITAKEALNHESLKRDDFSPTIRDMLILPSNILQLINVIGNNIQRNVLKDIRQEAEKYGEILECTFIGGHVYLEFKEPSSALLACSKLSGRVLDSKEILAVFYPMDLWNKKIFY